MSELLAYLERNQDMLVHYAARRRRGEPISTAFVESAVNEIVAKRMNKKQQMRWKILKAAGSFQSTEIVTRACGDGQNPGATDDRTF
jgi:hypothetical protein